MFPLSLKTLSDQERHDYILRTYVLNKSENAETRKHKRDIDVIKSNHRFLWESEDVADTWEKQLARRYYDKLFKEYCIADLTRYKENKIALRWRIDSEVISGKGQFQCGSRKCEEREGLRSWEVNFSYQEDGKKKNALVKLRLCDEHSTQLNYTSRKREVKRLKHVEKQKKKEIFKGKKKRTSSTLDNEKGSDEKEENVEDLLNEEDNNTDVSKVNVTNEIDKDKNTELQCEEDFWSKEVHIETEQSTRESEFERFLEDLLL